MQRKFQVLDSITWKESKEHARRSATAFYDSRLLQNAAVRAAVVSALVWAPIYTLAYLLIPDVSLPRPVEIVIPLSLLAATYAAPWVLLKLAPQGEYRIGTDGVYTGARTLCPWSKFEGYRVVDSDALAGSNDLILKYRSGSVICYPLPEGPTSREIITLVRAFLPELPLDDPVARQGTRLSNLLGPGVLAAMLLRRRYSYEPWMCFAVALVTNVGSAAIGGTMLAILLAHRSFT